MPIGLLFEGVGAFFLETVGGGETEAEPVFLGIEGRCLATTAEEGDLIDGAHGLGSFHGSGYLYAKSSLTGSDALLSVAGPSPGGVGN
jgi:hypothetical protein